MRKLQLSVDIEAPAKRVWQVLWDPDSFREWTSVFAPPLEQPVQADLRGHKDYVKRPC